MSSIDIIKNPIKDAMKKFDPFFKSSMNTGVPLLNIVTNYILRRKGKQMRPMLVFLSAKLNGEINKSTYTAAALIELLHTATLVHDDVVDESYQRRGFFSVFALWKSKIAVLVGDFLLSKGLLLAIDNNEFELLRIVSEAVREMAEGELLQIEKARKLNITEEVYFEIIRKKTATLIASCSACGAHSVGLRDEPLKQMKLFGEYMGIAFQIKDDLFDYQKTNAVGKPTGNDIQEKKMTLPLIFALRNASAKDKRKVLRLVKRKKKKDRDIRFIINFVTEKGGLEYANQQMNKYKDMALDILSKFPENEAKIALIELVNYTTTRKK